MKRMSVWVMIIYCVIYFSLFNDVHAKEITTLAQVNHSWTGQKLDQDVTIQQIKLKKGDILTWHDHLELTCNLIVSGILEIEMADGTKGQFQTGDAFCEPIGELHQGRAIDDVVIHRFIAIGNN